MNNYPLFSSLFPKIILPDNIGFLKGSEDQINQTLESILSEFLYRYIQIHTSASSDSAFYGFELLTKDRLSLEIPGTNGLALLINPSQNLDLTAIPITFSYQWPILRYVSQFNYQFFGGTINQYTDLLLQIVGISQRSFINQAIFAFSNDVQDPIGDFIILVNDELPLEDKIEINQVDPETDIDNINQKISEKGLQDHVQQVVFTKYAKINEGTFDEKLDRLKILFEPQLGFFTEESIKEILIPRFSLTLGPLSLGLKFPKSILQPKDTNIEASAILFRVGTVDYTTESGLEFQTFTDFSLNTPSYLLNTKFSIDFKGVKLDLSRTTNIPEAIADGRPTDFIGVYAEDLTIGFPDIFKNKDGDAVTIKGKRLLIGTGGISGIIALEAGEALDLRLGNKNGFSIALEEFFLEFRQNAVIGGGAKGEMTIPFGGREDSKKQIGIDLTFSQNGDFAIVGKNIDVAFKLGNFLTFKVKNLEVGNVGDRFYVAVGGEMTLDFKKQENNPDSEVVKGNVTIDIRRLLIWEDGSLEFESGGVTLPTSIKLEIGPVLFSVTKLHFGTYKDNNKDRRYYYIGFDGGLKAGEAGVDIQGKGIRYFFSADDKPFDHFFKMDGIGIDLSIPKKDPKLILKGFLLIKDEYYAGNVQFGIPKIGLKGGATMMLDPNYPAFFIDAFLDLPAPIPLGPTGLAIYGFRGVFGSNFGLDKAENETWWEFYKKPKIGIRAANNLADVGDDGRIGKFIRKKGGIIIGAGATIGTMGDDGWTFSSKILLLLALPDVFILAGQASILSERGNLDGPNDPPFSVALIISSDSIQVGIAVNYLIPDSGDVLNLKGALELAFFYKDSSAWYVNIGQENPEEKRISARLLSLFDVYAFLMISAKGIRAGAGFQWGIRKQYGPVSVELAVFMHTRGFISFKPIQLGGSLELGGIVKVKLAFFSLGVSVRAFLAAEAPCPMMIKGELEVKVGTPWPLPDINIQVGLHWLIRDCPDIKPLPIVSLPDTDKKDTPTPTAAVHIPSGQTFELPSFSNLPNGSELPDSCTIPLDCFVDIVFSQNILPIGVDNIGGHLDWVENKVIVPPQKGVSNQKEHFLEVSSVTIKYWEDNTWKEYKVYEQMKEIIRGIEALKNSGGINENDLKDLKDGYWQLTEPNKINKLRLLAQNVFSYTTNAVSGSLSLEGLGFSETSILCRKNITEKTCIHWEDQILHTQFPDGQLFDYKGLTFRLKANANNVVAHDEIKSWYLDTLADWEILFDEPIAELHELQLVTDSEITVSYYRLDTRVNEKTKMPESFYRLLPDESQTYNTNGNIGATLKLQFPRISDEPFDRLAIKASRPAKVQVYQQKTNLYLGGRINTQNSNLEYFSGELDDLKIFNSALDAAKITEAMKASRYLNLNSQYQTVGINPTHLVSWWDMAQGLGTDLIGPNSGVFNNGITTGSRELSGGKTTETWKMDFNNPMFVNHHQSISFENDDYTLMAWIRPGISVKKGYHTLFSKQNGNEGYYFGLEIISSSKPPGLNNNQNTIDLNPVHQYSFRLIWEDFGRRSENEPLRGERWISGKEVIYLDPYTVNITEWGPVGPPIPYQNGWIQAIGPGEDNRVRWYHVAVSVNRKTGQVRFFLDGRELDDFQSDKIKSPSGAGGTYVKKLCFTTQKVRETLLTLPSDDKITSELNSMSREMTQFIQPIWRPNTRFLVEVKGRDNLKNGNDQQTYYFGFQTKGPLGHYPKSIVDRAGELENLLPYVDFDKSYPNADGYLANTKPLYYAEPDIRLFFNRPYMYTMFSDWGTERESKLSLKVFGAVKGNTGGEIDPINDGNWEINTLNAQTDDATFLERINEFIEANHPCTEGNCNCEVIKGGFANKWSLNAAYKLKGLDAGKLYTAVFYAHYRYDSPDYLNEGPREVLRYVFRTSRYEHMKAQVLSFYLKKGETETKEALFGLDVLAESNQLQKAALLLNGKLLDPELERNFADPFDRLVNGILKLSPLTPPACTEVNIIKNQGRIIGLCVRNPEPFFDPKISRKELIRLDAFKFLAEQNTDKIRILFSKDRSQIWISELSDTQHLSLNFQDPVGLEFAHVLFDGAKYSASPKESDHAKITFSLTK